VKVLAARKRTVKALVVKVLAVAWSD